MKRTLALLLCVLTVLGTSSCSFLRQKTPSESDVSVSDPLEDETVLSGYETVIEEYCALMLRKKNGEVAPVLADEKAERLGRPIAKALELITEKSEDPTSMGYAIKDIDGDGIDELILMSRNCFLRMLFTLNGSTPVLLLNYGFYLIDRDGGVYGSEYTAESNCSVYVMQRLHEGALLGLKYGTKQRDDGETVAYRLENGAEVEIDELEYRDLRARTDSAMGAPTTPQYRNKAAGYRFVSAISTDAPTNQAPVADASTYEGILSMYRGIVGMLVGHTREDWIRGAYDDMYNFRDNEAYGIFCALFDKCSQTYPRESFSRYDYKVEGRNAFGYAMRDLNGDGVDELLLMTDRFNILAVFTQRGAKAVLLKWIDGTCSLGNDGILRVMKYNSDFSEIEFSTYSITDQGSLQNDVYLLWAPVHPGDRWSGNGNFVVDAHGNRIRIPDEEGRKLHGIYAADMEHDGSVTYTKLYSGLRFVRLYDEIFPAVKKYVYSSVSEYGVTVTAVEDECVTFSMDYFLYDDASPYPVYETVITATATKQKHAYVFDNGVVKGTLELCYNAVWVTIVESADENIRCNAYFFEEQRYDA